MPRAKPHYAPHGADERNRRSRSLRGMAVLALLITALCIAWLVAVYRAPPF